LEKKKEKKKKDSLPPPAFPIFFLLPALPHLLDCAPQPTNVSIPPFSLHQTTPKGHCHLPSWTVKAEAVVSIKHGAVLEDNSSDWLCD